MNDQEIITLINKTLADEFEVPAEKMVPDAHLRDDLNFDSLDVVDMVVALEEAFSFKLPDRKALQDIHTLGDIHAFIIKIKNDQGSAT